MAGKLKCPHCGKCIGEAVTEEGAEVTLQTNKPIKTRKQKVVIEKICQRCKNYYYMIVSDPASPPQQPRPQPQRT